MKRVYRADRVHTGRPGGLIESGALLEEDGTIVWVGPWEQRPVREGEELEMIDLGAATLMPGLIDAHVHLSLDGGDDPVGALRAENDRQLLVVMFRNARRLLRSGVTTAREMGAPAYLDLVVKDKIDSGIAVGPRLLVSNRPITTTGGHCWFMGCECDDASAIRRAVREHAKAGADLIKLMVSGGYMTPGSAPWICQYGRHEIETAVYESHLRGKKIAVHAHDTIGIRHSVEAGVDTIEHCTWLTPDGVRYEENTAWRIAESGICVCLTVNHRVKLWQGREKEQWLERARAMRELGVRFIAGTDAGIRHVGHDQFIGALEAMRELGMTNEEILVSATSLAAEACGVGETVGSLEAGKRADMLVVSGNPLDRLEDLRGLERIIKDGEDMLPELDHK
mgnify:CR=1 FL=1